MSETIVKRIKIEGFKSIRSLDLTLDNLNILIGANGSGKSNFIAAYLYRLRESERPYYSNIVNTIQLVAPFFEDFDLHRDRLNESQIKIEWKQKGSDAYFDAHSLSDGTLRFICLATLLMQPEKNMPQAILLDEPELGLHPYAIKLLADLLEIAAKHTQIIVSTQSVTLVDEFEPENIIVVESHRGESIFQKLYTDKIEHWLEDYSLGELWEKNVMGGRPTL